MTTQTNDTKPARLYRSPDDRMIAGVAGGLGAYLGIDPVLVRIIFVVLAVLGGGGILAYLIAWLVVPEEPADPNDIEPGRVERPARSAGAVRLFTGFVLVAVGVGLLVERTVPWFNHFLWPLVLVALGAALLFRGATR